MKRFTTSINSVCSIPQDFLSLQRGIFSRKGYWIFINRIIQPLKSTQIKLNTGCHTIYQQLVVYVDFNYNFGLDLGAHFVYFLVIFGLNCSYCVLQFFFFFIRDLRSRSDGANSPIRIRHSERAAYFFSYRTVSLRLPGSLTTPSGWYHTPKGCDNETFNARTRVWAAILAQNNQFSNKSCGWVLAKIASLAKIVFSF